MKVLKCRIHDEDMCSDSFNPEPCFGGYVLKVKVQYKIFDLDNPTLPGANPSAEAEEEEEEGETKVRALDLLHQYENLTECPYITTKKELTKYFKDNMPGFKKCIEQCVDEEDVCCKKTDEEKKEQVNGVCKEWLCHIQEFMKFLKDNWSNVQVYTTSCDNIDEPGSKCFYVGDDESDYFYFIKHSLKEEKF